MPEIIQLGTVVTGFVLSFYGGAALVAHWSDGKPWTVAKSYVKAIERLELAWDGTFVPVSFCVLVVIGSLFWGYARDASQDVSLLFNYPSQDDFARGNLKIDYQVTNDTTRTITVEDFRSIEIASTSKLYEPYSGIGLCSDKSIISLRDIDDRTNVEGSEPIKTTSAEYEVRTDKALSVDTDGTPSLNKIVFIQPGEEKEMKVSFPKFEHDYSRWNTMTVCPSFKVFGSHYGVREIVCQGASRVMFPLAEYGDRISNIEPNRHMNILLQSPPRGFGVIYAYLSTLMETTTDRNRGDCE